MTATTTTEAPEVSERDQRVAEAEAYVRTRFYPPLPYEYGAYAVQAVDACNEGDELRQIMLDPDLPLHPAGAQRDESGSVSMSAEGLVDVLRLWHMIEDPDEHDCSEYLIEKGTSPAPNGAFWVWDECEKCGTQTNRRRDSVL